MAYRINTNIPSMVAQRSLGKASEEQSRTMNRLSSGLRITSSSDDAAGLAISERLRGHIRSSRQAVRNTADAISLVQVAEGGLSELTNILIRLRELSVQSASDTLSDKERMFSDLEFQSLSEELDRIASVTKFNGRRLLDGSGGEYEFQVGIHNDDFEDRISFDAGEINVSTSSIGVKGLGVQSKSDAQDSLSQIDEAMMKVTGSRAMLGAVQNRLSSVSQNLTVSIEGQAATKSRIVDADYAHETSNNVRQNILVQAGIAVLAQANTKTQSVLKLIG